MRRTLFVLALALLLLSAVTAPALADTGATVSGSFTYTCPFTGNDTTVVVAAIQTVGFHGTGAVQVSGPGLKFTAPVLSVNVQGDMAYLAGPMQKARPGGLNGGWWYMALRGGEEPGAVGAFTGKKGALAAVASADDLGVGVQTLVSGWLVVH